MSSPDRPPELDPDIVRAILERVTPLVPEAQRAELERVEQQVRDDYAGQRVQIRKRNKGKVEQKYADVMRDALTNAPDNEVIKKHGISRATLYRIVKRRAKDGL